MREGPAAAARASKSARVWIAVTVPQVNRRGRRCMVAEREADLAIVVRRRRALDFASPARRRQQGEHEENGGA